MIVYRLARFYMRSGMPLVPAIRKAIKTASRGF